MPSTRTLIKTVIATAVVAGSFVATAAPSVASAPAPASWSAQILTLINSERSAHHVSALTANANLAAAAAVHVKNMATHNVLGRTPGELSVYKQDLAAGYKATHDGANNGAFAGTANMTLAGAVAIENFFAAQPSTSPMKINLDSKLYKNVGIAIYLDTTHKTLWVSEYFGSK
jgi:hypothetical protein